MINRNLYEKIMSRVSQTVMRTLNERDFDEDGNWEFDEEIDDNSEKPTAWWEGIYDLTTNQIFSDDEAYDISIDPRTDRWHGLHKYVCFQAIPDDYYGYYRSATYFDPAEGEMKINGYQIDVPYPVIFTTNEHNGKYYYEGDDDTIEEFDNFTEQQIEKITEYLNDNVSVNYWDWE